MMAEETVDSFPNYAELTRTQGWSRAAAAPITGMEATERILDPTLDRYREGALLGTGGMGKVVLARDARIGREVAIKELHQNRELAHEDRMRFLREARVQGASVDRAGLRYRSAPRRDDVLHDAARARQDARRDRRRVAARAIRLHARATRSASC